MRYRFPAVLALLVVAATILTGTPALAAPAGQPASSTALQVGNESVRATTDSQQFTPIVAVSNTSSYLDIPASEVETSRFGTANLDVTSSVAVESSRLREQFLEIGIFQAFNDAETTRAQTEILHQSAAEIERRTTALRSLQTQTLREYNRGAISEAMFLRRLAIIDGRARELTVTVDRILQAVGQSPSYSLPNSLRTRFQNLRARPMLFQGPNRQRISRAISGAQPPARVYIEASADGIVLARATGNSYTREAFLDSQYRVNNSDQFTGGDRAPISTAYERARNLYPWTIENAITAPSATGFGNTSIYRITIDHTQGTLVSYLDGSTTNVFHEVQEKRLSALPTENATNTTDQLHLEVNRTHDSGPMEVVVQGANTTRGVSAQVGVNGQFVGGTGDDGRLWTIEPRGEVTVTAISASGNRIELHIPAAA